MNNTYIKTYRKCLNNEIFKEKPFDRWHAFEYLMLRAQRFPIDIVIKGQPIHLDVGQLIEGEETMAEKWGWSRGKVRRFLELLVNRGMITKNGTANGTVITIENYTLYQCGEPEDSTSDSTSHSTSKKKVKESKRNSFAPQDIKPGGAAYKPFEKEEWELDPDYGIDTPEYFKKKLKEHKEE